MPRSSARSQHQATYATKSSNPSAVSRSRTPGWWSGRSPVRTSSSLTRRRAAPSSIRSTSAGSWRCARCVANAQYLQCETHVRDSDSVRLREKVTRRVATPVRLQGASALEGEGEVVGVALVAAQRLELVAGRVQGALAARPPVKAGGLRLALRHVADEVVVDLAGVVVAAHAVAAADLELADLRHQPVEGRAGAERVGGLVVGEAAPLGVDAALKHRVGQRRLEVTQEPLEVRRVALDPGALDGRLPQVRPERPGAARVGVPLRGAPPLPNAPPPRPAATAG